jgi:hypothetical protein
MSNQPYPYKLIEKLKARNKLLERVINAYLNYQACSDTGDVMGEGNAWQDFLDALNEAARSVE